MGSKRAILTRVVANLDETLGDGASGRYFAFVGRCRIGVVMSVKSQVIDLLQREACAALTP